MYKKKKKRLSSDAVLVRFHSIKDEGPGSSPMPSEGVSENRGETRGSAPECPGWESPGSCFLSWLHHWEVIPTLPAKT